MGMVWDWIAKGVTHLVGTAKDAFAGIVGKGLATFGLTVVSFDAVLPRLKEFVVQNMSGLNGPALEFLAFLQIGTVMSMILSALTVRLAWKTFIIPKSLADQLPGAVQ